MGFAHVQGGISSPTGGFTSMTVSLPVSPTAVHLVCIGICLDAGSSASHLKVARVGNGNNYTLTTGTPVFDGSLSVWLLYYLNASSNANNVVTIDVDGSVPDADLWIDEF